MCLQVLRPNERAILIIRTLANELFYRELRLILKNDSKVFLIGKGFVKEQYSTAEKVKKVRSAFLRPKKVDKAYASKIQIFTQDNHRFYWICIDLFC